MKKHKFKSPAAFLKELMSLYFSEEELFRGNLMEGENHEALNPVIIANILGRWFSNDGMWELDQKDVANSGKTAVSDVLRAINDGNMTSDVLGHQMTCDNAVVQCTVPGCSEVLRRCDLQKHMEVATDVHARVASRLAKRLERQLAAGDWATLVSSAIQNSYHQLLTNIETEQTAFDLNWEKHLANLETEGLNVSRIGSLEHLKSEVARWKERAEEAERELDDWKKRALAAEGKLARSRSQQAHHLQSDGDDHVSTSEARQVRTYGKSSAPAKKTTSPALPSQAVRPVPAPKPVPGHNPPGEHPDVLVAEVEEFDWVILRVGKLHLEMNAAKSFVDVNFDVWYSVLAEEIEFKSEGAQRVARNFADHHKTMQLIEIAIRVGQM
ncbi:Hypp6633 [Branchiostoma lanceolatum]|uniref:Hypp6633 protein n=1 Tax=Branchiostoma lanceolatum TaxID=7740 RepID=A0A8J9YV67_BRALA|nr:Hypp6633 [Branchiostoma lanceolatum]